MVENIRREVHQQIFINPGAGSATEIPSSQPSYLFTVSAFEKCIFIIVCSCPVVSIAIIARKEYQDNIILGLLYGDFQNLADAQHIAAQPV